MYTTVVRKELSSGTQPITLKLGSVSSTNAGKAPQVWARCVNVNNAPNGVCTGKTQKRGLVRAHGSVAAWLRLRCSWPSTSLDDGSSCQYGSGTYLMRILCYAREDPSLESGCADSGPTTLLPSSGELALAHAISKGRVPDMS